jgi:hypothetical protein
LVSIHNLGLRDGIRFAVGEPNGRRSGTWRLWGDKKGDVYLSMRTCGRMLKASFDRDRRCSVGFTSEYEKIAKERFKVANRHWERWKLPDGEVVRLAQIVFPDSDLVSHDAKDGDPMRWLPAPGPGRAVVVSNLCRRASVQRCQLAGFWRRTYRRHARSDAVYVGRVHLASDRRGLKGPHRRCARESCTAPASRCVTAHRSKSANSDLGTPRLDRRYVLH